MSANHDKVFVFTFAGVLAFLIGLAVVIYIVAGVIQSNTIGAGEDPARTARIEARIQPVGQVNTDPNAAVAQPVVEEGAADKTPAQVVAEVCAGCHNSGVLNAPKVGDKAAWSTVMAAGFDAVMNNAINGKGAMPPRGGSPALTDEQVAGAIKWMLNESGL